MKPPLPLEIPGLADAILEEDRNRLAAFVDVPRDLCGVPVRQFTVRHAIALELAESPFIVGGKIDAADVALFLWVVGGHDCHPDHREAAQAAFAQTLRGVNAREAVAEIRAYLDEADASSPGGDERRRRGATSWPASLVDRLARAYGWAEADILDLPLARAWQYVRRIMLHENPKATFIDPSDKLRGEYLRQLNAGGDK